MTDVALAGPRTTIPKPKTPRGPRITPRIRRAVEALVTGEAKTQQQAARLAKLNPQHLCVALKKPHVEVFYERRTREIIRSAQMRAVANVVKLMNAQSEHVAADTNFKVLAINGIKPSTDAQISINVDIKAGYVIDLTGGRGPVIEHEANPLKSLDVGDSAP